jgi:hypothetical protein
MDRQDVAPVALVAVLALVAALLAAAVDNAAVRAVLGAVVATATVVATYRAAASAALMVGADTLRALPSEPDLTVIRQDRRNPIFDRTTGLFTDWYVRLRLEEEIARAARYGQHFTVATITSDAPITRDLTSAVAKTLRHVDYAADLGPAVVVVLPNTATEGAEIWRDRLTLPGACSVNIREYPNDGKTVSDLLGEDQWAWPSQEFSQAS